MIRKSGAAAHDLVAVILAACDTDMDRRRAPNLGSRRDVGRRSSGASGCSSRFRLRRRTGRDLRRGRRGQVAELVGERKKAEVADSPGADPDVEGGEFCCDLLGGAAGPADTGDGIAGDIVLQGRFDGGDHLGSFFSRGGRPAAGAAHAHALDVLGKQLLTTAGYGTGVDTE